MWYNVDFNKLGALLLPTFLRKPRLLGFVVALLSGVDNIWYKWKEQRTKTLTALDQNGQVYNLEFWLNNNYDNVQKRIRIMDGWQYEPQYIYTRPENRPWYLGSRFLFPKSYYADTAVDFIVKVPREVWQKNEIPIRAYINKVKIAGKRYNVEFN